MACRGVGYFDSKGNFFKRAADATVSDLAAILGKIGDGDGDSVDETNDCRVQYLNAGDIGLAAGQSVTFTTAATLSGLLPERA